EVGIGGVMPMPPDAAAPPQWLPYVRAVDVDATAARAQSLGARVELPPTDIGDVGRVAVLTDPQGASIALYRPGEA
ncbi:VOC family protein, partial [bacterium]|nr:VOC family protein [bacterium]